MTGRHFCGGGVGGGEYVADADFNHCKNLTAVLSIL